MKMDKFHVHGRNLFQVMENQQYASEIMTTTSTPGLLAETLKEEIPEIEWAATTTWINSYTLSIKDHNVKARGYHVGPDFFHLFSYPLIQGKPDKVLNEKYNIIISRSLARKLFNTEENILGKTVVFQHQDAFQVSGVFEDLPSNSSTQFDFVLSFELFKDQNEWVKHWGNNGPSTFVVLKDGSKGTNVSEKIKDFVSRRNEGSTVTLFLSPYADRYLFGRYVNGKQEGGRIDYVKLFSMIAIFILFIACINFMNLATARASKKAKEVGIKKSIGVQRNSLVLQFLSESLVTSFLSMSLGVMTVWFLLPQFNLITDKHIEIPFQHLYFWILFFGIALLTGLLAGSYPAFYLSRFKPVSVLKGDVKGSMGELWARKGLVVFQFFLSVILIVFVLVVYKQIDFVQSKNLGYAKENLVWFPIEGDLRNKLEAFLSEIRKTPGIKYASSINHPLLGRNNNTSDLYWDGKFPDEKILFENIRVDYDFLETIGFELKEGRSFSREFGTDTAKVIFNEAGIRAMNMENPIGKVIKLWNQYNLEIIGVVKDFNFQSLHNPVNPLFFVLDQKNTDFILVRLDAHGDQGVINKLEQLYKQFNPGFAFEIKFQEEQYQRLYSSEKRVSILSFYFAGFAILISCLGLFALAAFTAERRLKEIGIRKVLGSSELGIVIMITSDFIQLVFWAIILGLPISYFLLQIWLEQFAFHIDLKLWYFLFSGIISIFIAWLSVATQAFRASHVNPVECLRSE